MTNYIIRMDGIEYESYRDGRPFSLADAWREVQGVRHCDILAPSGRVVLANAGSMSVRTYDLPERARAARRDAANLRHARYRRNCPVCGHLCWRNDSRHAWWHPVAGCDLEMFHDDAPTVAAAERHPFEVIGAVLVDVR